MIVSKSKKFIFIHVPKTGGTSLTKILELYSNPITKNPIWASRIQKYFGRKISNHLELFPKHVTINEAMQMTKPEQFKRYFKFGFMRNPFDFIVSSYFYQKSDPNNVNYDKVNNFSGFEDFIYQMPHSSDFQKTYVSINNKCALDYIANFNNFNSEIRKLEKILAIDFSALRKLNTSNHNAFQTYYNSELKNQVAKLYHDDIKFYNNQFNIDCRDF